MSYNRRILEEIMLKCLLGQFREADIKKVIEIKTSCYYSHDLNASNYISKHIQPFCENNIMRILLMINCDQLKQQFKALFLKKLNTAALAEVEKTIEGLRGEEGKYQLIPNDFLLIYLENLGSSIDFNCYSISEIRGICMVFDVLDRGEISNQLQVIEFINQVFIKSKDDAKSLLIARLMKEIEGYSKGKQIALLEFLCSINQINGTPGVTLPKTNFKVNVNVSLNSNQISDSDWVDRYDFNTTLFEMLTIFIISFKINIDLYEISYSIGSNKQKTVLDCSSLNYSKSLREVFNLLPNEKDNDVMIELNQLNPIENEALYLDKGSLRKDILEELKGLFKGREMIDVRSLLAYLGNSHVDQIIQAVFMGVYFQQLEQMSAYLRFETRECYQLLHLLIGFRGKNKGKPYLRNIFPEDMICLKIEQYKPGLIMKRGNEENEFELKKKQQQEEIKGMEFRLKQTEEEIKERDENMKKAKEEISKLQLVIEVTEAQIEAKDEERKKLELVLNNKDEELREYELKTKNTQDTMNKHTLVMNDSDKKIEEIAEEIKRGEEKKKNIEEEVKELEEEIKRTEEEEVKELEEEIKKREKDVAVIKTAIKELEVERKKREEEAKEINEKNKELEIVKQKKGKKIALIKEKINEQRIEIKKTEEEIKELEIAKKKTEKEGEKKEFEIKKTSEEVKEIEEKKKDTFEQILKTKDFLEELESKIKEAKDLQERKDTEEKIEAKVIEIGSKDEKIKELTLERTDSEKIRQQGNTENKIKETKVDIKILKDIKIEQDSIRVVTQEKPHISEWTSIEIKQGYVKDERDQPGFFNCSIQQTTINITNIPDNLKESLDYIEKKKMLNLAFNLVRTDKDQLIVWLQSFFDHFLKQNYEGELRDFIQALSCFDLKTLFQFELDSFLYQLFNQTNSKEKDSINFFNDIISKKNLNELLGSLNAVKFFYYMLNLFLKYPMQYDSVISNEAFNSLVLPLLSNEVILRDEEAKMYAIVFAFYKARNPNLEDHKLNTMCSLIINKEVSDTIFYALSLKTPSDLFDFPNLLKDNDESHWPLNAVLIQLLHCHQYLKYTPEYDLEILGISLYSLISSNQNKMDFSSLYNELKEIKNSLKGSYNIVKHVLLSLKSNSLSLFSKLNNDLYTTNSHFLIAEKELQCNDLMQTGLITITDDFSKNLLSYCSAKNKNQKYSFSTMSGISSYSHNHKFYYQTQNQKNFCFYINTQFTLNLNESRLVSYLERDCYPLIYLEVLNKMPPFNKQNAELVLTEYRKMIDEGQLTKLDIQRKLSQKECNQNVKMILNS